jgi:disulfide bond formation protein DsbB
MNNSSEFGGISPMNVHFNRSMKIGGAVAILLFTILLSACRGGGNPPAAVINVAGPDGADLYQQTCAACHGADSKGRPNLGKDLTASEFVNSQSDQALLAFIKQGRMPNDGGNTTGVPMPPKGGNPALTDEQILEIIAYIRTQ